MYLFKEVNDDLATKCIIIDDLTKFKFTYENRNNENVDGTKDFYAVYDSEWFLLSDDDIEPIDTLTEINNNVEILNSISNIDTNIYLSRLIFQKYIFIFQCDESYESTQINRYKTELTSIYDEIRKSLVPSTDDDDESNTVKELLISTLDPLYLQNSNNQIELIYKTYNNIRILNIQIKNLTSGELVYDERFKILNPSKIVNDKKFYELLKIVPLKMTWVQLLQYDLNLATLNQVMQEYVRNEIRSTYITTASYEFPTNITIIINKIDLIITINSTRYQIYETTSGQMFEELFE